MNYSNKMVALKKTIIIRQKYILLQYKIVDINCFLKIL